jgi:hypothetical protein
VRVSPPATRRERIFLALDAPAGKTRAGIVQPPQGVDAKVIPDNTEARAQQESGHDEPSLFEVPESSAVEPIVQCRPEGAQQGAVPFNPGRAEDALQALEGRAGGRSGLQESASSMFSL